MKQIHDMMYKWVSELDRIQFEALVKDAVQQYMPSSFHMFSPKLRANAVLNLLKSRFSNEKTLAVIFAQGSLTSTSFNSILFTKVLNSMQKDILSDQQKAEDVYYYEVLQAQSDDDRLLSSLNDFAKAQLDPTISPYLSQ